MLATFCMFTRLLKLLFSFSFILTLKALRIAEIWVSGGLPACLLALLPTGFLR